VQGIFCFYMKPACWVEMEKQKKTEVAPALQ